MEHIPKSIGHQNQLQHYSLQATNITYTAADACLRRCCQVGNMLASSSCHIITDVVSCCGNFRLVQCMLSCMHNTSKCRILSAKDAASNMLLGTHYTSVHIILSATYEF